MSVHGGKAGVAIAGIEVRETLTLSIHGLSTEDCIQPAQVLRAMSISLGTVTSRP
jgi:hypothetical protein